MEALHGVLRRVLTERQKDFHVPPKDLSQLAVFLHIKPNTTIQPNSHYHFFAAYVCKNIKAIYIAYRYILVEDILLREPP